MNMSGLLSPLAGVAKTNLTSFCVTRAQTRGSTAYVSQSVCAVLCCVLVKQATRVNVSVSVSVRLNESESAIAAN